MNSRVVVVGDVAISGWGRVHVLVPPGLVLVVVVQVVVVVGELH